MTRVSRGPKVYGRSIDTTEINMLWLSSRIPLPACKNPLLTILRVAGYT